MPLYDFNVMVSVETDAPLRQTRSALAEETRDWLKEVDWLTRYGINLTVDVKTVS